MKVYAVTIDLAATRTWAEACEKTSKLDANIQRLAKNSGEAVHMHQWKTPVEGAPVVLIECSEAFASKIMRMPLVHSVEPAKGATIRRSSAPAIEPPEAMTPPPKRPKGP